ncbi:conserved unknown protein [Ectocarpus siliculosus]|uniref:Pentacotripeptide-repeat region of PRORP domain-containing protein n=1 Tax=Ectocarpus siliculosus TaxID=2880 RepID=D8LHV5_ECTSI|nr:conserved unknown protein [Ectocarpus siliculosus]|eukprot:CBN74386.1 conserved unknown protein [Ectocarpus siliculosus]
MLSTITHPSRRAQKQEEALELLGEMREAGLTPDAVSFTSAMGACLKRGRWTERVFLLEKMRALGVVPGVITYHALMVACAKCTQVWSWLRDVAYAETIALDAANTMGTCYSRGVSLEK